MALVVAYFVVQLIGQIDWHEVWRALQHLSWWQVPLLVGLLLMRQTLNSMPLALYIPGVSPYRAVLNDQIAFVIGTVAPPPSDLAMRTAMFSSWGVPLAAGVAGALLHKLTFWIARFGIPVVGFAVLLVRGDSLGLRLVDLASIAFSLTLVGGLFVVMRTDALAYMVGIRSGALVLGVTERLRFIPALRSRIRTVDPAAWADGCVRFRADLAGRFHRGFPWGLAAMAGMLALDALMLVLCLRFVGVGGAEAPVSVVVAAYAVAFPLTLFPFSGIGLLDAALLGAVTAFAGHAVEAPVVAAILVWRVFTLGGPVVLGGASIALWYYTMEPETGLWEILRSGGAKRSA